MAEVVQLFEGHPQRFHGECQKCGQTDYLPWATERGVRFCGQCFEKYALAYAREAALDLLAAAKRQEAAEAFHLSCPECEGNEIPELCEACFPHYDDARVMRRAAIAKAEGA